MRPNETLEALQRLTDAVRDHRLAITVEALNELADAEDNARAVLGRAKRAAVAEPEAVRFTEEMIGYLEMKLTGFRQNYPDYHCIVQTCANYLEQARAIVARANRGES